MIRTDEDCIMGEFMGRAMGRRSFFIGVGAAALTSAAVGVAGYASSRNGTAGLGGTARSGGTPSLRRSPPDQPPLLDLPRIPWEGGPEFWRDFPKAADAGWTDPAFFPLAVFFGRPAHARQLKSVGINTFQCVEHNDPLSVATSEGIYCIAHDEWTEAEVGDNPMVVGHFVHDECDMGLSCSGGNEYERLADHNRAISDIRARNDGRFVNSNYSKGVLGTWWASNTMPDLMRAADVISVDNYAYTSPDTGYAITQSESWPEGTPAMRSATYGWLTDRMRAYQSPPGIRPNWMFVETAMPFLNDTGARTISPEEIEGACWSAIIHEARGIMFFQHNNDGVNGGYSLVDCSEARKELIRASNARITSLAPIINTQSYEWSFGPDVDTMLKASGDSAYIFAEIALATGPGTRTFTLPPSIRGTTVDVVDEGRTLDVVHGSFSDDFPFEHTHHAYRIAL